MTERLLAIGDGFWNLRGSFKLGGLLELGTQASLVRRADGSFLLLDSYTLRGEVREQILELTNGGKSIETVLHLHPFHTLHVLALAKELPHAEHIGSARHRARAPEVRWSADSIESEAVAQRFATDLELWVPPGVDFISPDERLHFSSVLAFHKASGTLHVDDTLGWSTLPLIRGLAFHPTLARVLERRPGAASAFRTWANQLARHCGGVQRLCTAHMQGLPPAELSGEALEVAIHRALAKVEPTLKAHERRWG